MKEDKNNRLLESLTLLIQPLHQKVIQTFNQLSAKLTEKEDKKTEVVKRRFRIISSYLKGKSEETKKDKFLGGVEGVDYTKEEQVLATVRMLMKQNLYEKIYQEEEDRKSIIHYRMIEQVKYYDLPGMKLEDYIRKAFYGREN